MAINLAKPGINPFIKKPSTSWAEFYFNMGVDMLQNTLVGQGTKQVSTEIADVFGTTSTNVENTIDNVLFAKSLAEEYDKVIKSGKTIIGGVPFTGGNVILMTSVLSGILATTKLNKNGDLIRDIGPAVQAYWLGATSAKIPVPTIPCIGSVKNLTTNVGLSFNPGVWTHIPVVTNSEPWPWLISFIISANLHLLTVGGMFFCNCQYPPPAPPAPGVLPWIGYVTKPLAAGPFTGKTWKDIVKATGVGVAEATLAAGIGTIAEGKDLTAQNIGDRIISGLTDAGSNTNIDSNQRNALAALSTGDQNQIASASQTLNTNKKV